MILRVWSIYTLWAWLAVVMQGTTKVFNILKHLLYLFGGCFEGYSFLMSEYWVDCASHLSGFYVFIVQVELVFTETLVDVLWQANRLVDHNLTVEWLTLLKKMKTDTHGE